MQSEVKGVGMNHSDLQIADPLTERELEVLQLLAEGLSNREIGERLVLTLYTVKWYVKQIYSKLQLSSRAQAATIARELGLLHPQEATHNLPTPVTPLIGRESELRQLAAYLADPAVRQITILGPGGIGKTRLAQEAARQNLAQFEHGARFVAQDGVSSAEHLVAAIADAVGFQFYSPHDPHQQLLNYFREKNMLLMLDNFEHLLVCADLVSDILAAAPDLTVLVTSRQQLNIYGEVLFSLEGLTYPEDDTSENVDGFSAVQLYLERAHRVHPNMQPTPDVWQQIARICRLLEGLPLAIELAAAWAMALSPKQIAAEIEQGLNFLQAETRDVAERHRSVRAVFDHSYALLNAAERDVFRKLSVFRGGFTVEAAQAVVGASLKTLASLQGASLLRREGPERYGLHELLRQYGAEKMAENNAEETEVNEQHSRYYLAYAGQWAQELQAGDQQRALQQIEQEIDNIHQAWNRTVDNGNIAALDHASGLWFYFEIRGLYREGRERYAAAINACDADHDLTLGRLLAGQCVFAFRLGDYDESETLSRRSIECLNRSGALDETSLPLLNLGNVVRFRQGSEAARQLYEEAYRVACIAEDQWSIACALDNLAIIAFDTGDMVEARSLLRGANEIRRTSGDRWGLAMNLANQGELALQSGDAEEAERHYEQALEIARSIDQPMIIAGALSGLGELTFNANDYDTAQYCYHEALTINRQMGHRQDVIAAQTGLVRIQGKRGDFMAARRNACTALLLARDIGSEALMLMVLAGMTYSIAPSEPERAVELLALVDQHSQTTESIRNLYVADLDSLQQLQPERYEAAWARGTTLDLHETVNTLLHDCATDAKK